MYPPHRQSADELDFQNEISVMSTLRHPNLVLFLGAVLAQEPKMLISEYLDGGRHVSSSSYDIACILFFI
jgi:hypothetical protein